MARGRWWKLVGGSLAAAVVLAILVLVALTFSRLRAETVRLRRWTTGADKTLGTLSTRCSDSSYAYLRDSMESDERLERAIREAGCQGALDLQEDRERERRDALEGLIKARGCDAVLQDEAKLWASPEKAEARRAANKQFVVDALTQEMRDLRDLRAARRAAATPTPAFVTPTPAVSLAYASPTPTFSSLP